MSGSEDESGGSFIGNRAVVISAASHLASSSSIASSISSSGSSLRARGLSSGQKQLRMRYLELINRYVLGLPSLLFLINF